MLNPANGLRFDVYERVHLPVDVADIHELEEIELTPHIQIVHQDEQVLLRGNLLLSGAYASQGGETRESRTLTHWIPVEITLPLNRVRSLEDIRVDVENFDVDLLSARTLNITGVLSLSGVEVKEADASAAPAWVDEPFTVVHRREPEAAAEPQAARIESAPPEAAGASATPEPSEPSEPAAAQRADEPNELEPVHWTSLVFQQAEEAPQRAGDSEEGQPAGEREREEPAATFEGGSRLEENLQGTAAPPAAASPVEDHAAPLASDRPASAGEPASGQVGEEPAAEQAEPPAAIPEPLAEAVASAVPEQEAEPAKPDLKIALGAKKSEAQSDKPEALGLSALLQSNRREQEVRQAAAEEEQAKQQAEAAALASAQGEEIEWKSLFLSRDPNAEAFRKVRMCIVQRDDTLDAIAGRYQLNPRELVLYNRLAEHEVSEGQVLLIP